MKRTESPVVDYDSDPVLKQIKAKFDKTEEEKEKLKEQAKEFCSVLQPFLNKESALKTVLELEKKVIDSSTDPDCIDLSIGVQFPQKYLMHKLFVIGGSCRTNKLLSETVNQELVRIDSLFMDQVVVLWKERDILC